MFLIVVIFSLFIYYSSPKKEQWKEATLFIENNIQAKEVVIILGDTHFTLFDYYQNGLEIIKVTIYANQLENQRELKDLIPQLQNKNGYWLVQSNSYKTKGIYQAYFDQDYTPIQEKSFLDIEVRHYI